jgi:hypothetical protein
MKACTKTLHSLLLRHAQQRVEMLLVRVHAAVGDQPEQMQLAPARARILHRLDSTGFLKNSPFSIISVDARDVHVHDAPGADVQCPTSLLPICPSAGRQTARWCDQRVGILAQQRS